MAKSYSITVPTAFPRRATAWERAQHLIAIGGPIGFIPWVPATCASAVVAALAWWLRPGWIAVAAVTVGLYLVGGFAASTSERLLATEDPRNVVVDELAGQLVTFLFVLPSSWVLALAGFMLFRIFDISKPFPIRRLEHLPGGWGIMSDDILAGLYAAIVLLGFRALIS
jgi:phosphatidylglycerophosphatase A